jgi:hypothetical protein
MFRRVLTGLFAAALALAGAAVAPASAERPAGWVAAEQAALVQTGRAELRLVRASEGRGAPQHSFLGLLPVVGALQPARAVALTAPTGAPARPSTTARAAHGARAPPV